MKSFVAFFIFIMVSCSPNLSTTRIVSNEPAKPSINNPIFGPNQKLYWFTSENSGYYLTIIHNSTDLDYMRGLLVNNFLNTENATTTVPNWKGTYCVVVSYNRKDTKQQLRAKAVPISVANLKENTLERIFRIDWPNAAQNIEFCKGDLPTYNQSGVQISSTTDAAFTPEDLCPTCVGTIPSSYLALYAVPFDSSNKPIPLTKANQVPISQFQPATLKVTVDFSSYYFPSGTCSQSACKDQGKDCCINNQCVKDASEKAGSIESPDYLQAKKDVALDPSKFKNYPQIYNICTLPTPVSSSPTVQDTELPLQTANQRFETQSAQYYCLEEGKKPIPNFDLCNSKWLCVPQWIIKDPTFNGSCSTLDGKTGFQRYKEVKLDVWKLCGCKADPFPTDPDEDNPKCPDFVWKPIQDSEGRNLEFICSTTEVNPYADTLQYPYTLPARSAPHRFYRSDNGKSVDDVTTIQKETPEVTPEGLEFLYLDNTNKTDPDNVTLNMNALTGQFKVNLSQAHPALMVPVEFDTGYVISVISGSLNACPLCTKDTWEPSFFIWAPSEIGRGLEAVGYTTARNQVNSNLSLGNYEDTGFGRYCYLPPTMLPWSHKPEIDVNNQRRRRLLTQTALYMNGYQKDWFGFNQGAIIGSFDGVSWFSIGNIRKITSTSTKLFIAINKPFSDLTDNSAFQITVGRDVGNNQIPSQDFDTELTDADSRFNRGSSCQKYHVCENDTDCITQLGWEYTCADITKYKSSWPVFRSNADEKANSQIAQANFTNILRAYDQTGKVKRCVYRGNGAPCKKDYLNNIKSPEYAKLLACAPNFYCAALTETSLNSKIDREPAPNNVYYYGYVTDRLGRPQFYIGGDSTFPQEVKENLANTAKIYSKNGNVDDFGICRPGRLLITFSTPGTQPIVVSHAGKDSKQRTDFISEVASCDSNAIGNNRAITCPYIEESSATSTNYLNLAIKTTDTQIQNSQNLCGAESQYLQNGVKTSTFKIIELNRLATLSTIDQPSIVRDACLRRAGAACHTNLDCGPNELHEQQAFSFNQSFFGGTTAEMEFWRESLICGQGQIPPSVVPTASTATTKPEPYLLNRNRCCRNIGLEFTMYTQYQSTGGPDLIPDIDKSNIGLEVLKYPYNNPVASNRYSRYAITQPVEYSDGHAAQPVDQAPILYHDAGKPLTPKEYQWKTLNDTGRKTCCGAGFVRLFSDGTHNWSKTNRLALPIAGLSCLNYQDTLTFRRPLQVDEQNYNKDYQYFCISPGLTGEPYNGSPTTTPPPVLPGLQENSNQGIIGCTQVPLLQPSSNEITLPWDLSLVEARISTVPDEKPAGIVVQKKTLSSRAPYIPTPFLNATPISVNESAPVYFINKFAPAQSVYLPAYIGGRRNIIKITTSYYSDNTAVATEVATTEATPTVCENISQNPMVDLPENTWCIQNNNYTGGFDVLHVHGDQDPPGAASPSWDYGGFTVYFKTINTKTYDYCNDNLKNFNGATSAPTCTIDNDPMKPTDPGNIETVGMGGGNALYYLTKLGRLELVGIPQIFYEPLYCNTDRNSLVTGIFNLSAPTREEFESEGFRYRAETNSIKLYNIYNQNIPNYAEDFANPDSYVAMQNLISIPSVFSSYKFACCKNLGTEVLSFTECCSNFSVKDADGRQICKLPRGADLHVYFNRFVSGDGMGDWQPGGGLNDNDFIPETGEPNLTKEASEKIRALGVAYCSSGNVRYGAAFGYFYGQPNNGYFTQTANPEDNTLYSIIDSSLDYQGDPGDTISGAGTIRYLEGYRWNHHLYCAP